jgi:small subunit ribosomal protein S9
MALKLSKKSNKVQKVVKKTPTRSASSAGVRADAASAQVNLPTGEYTEGIGRRKVATARVRLYHQEGDFLVNGLVVGKYFSTVPLAASLYHKPLELTGTKGKFAISATVNGSGTVAQLDAIVHGLSRALIAYDPSHREVLKQAGYLTRDDRMKETRKIGTGGKARRKRQSPRR